MTTMRPALDVVDRSPGDELPPFNPMLEVGRSGLKRNSGYVDDEFLKPLRGRRGVQVYREMSDNSSVIGGWMYAVQQLLRQIEYRVEPASSSAEDRANARFVEQCMEDMSHSWGDMISEISSFLIYGWELSEVVYKKRVGPWEKDGKYRSKYTDGRFGWRKIVGRSQETLLRWMFDDTGELLGMVQMAAPRYETKVLDLRKCLLFRTTRAKNNPEGRSLLRNAYMPWYFLKRMQEIEAVGVERDLTGVPVAKVPEKLLSATPGSADHRMLQAIKSMVTAVRRNEQEGIVWPWSIDPETKQPDYVFELLTSGGSRQFDIGGIIDRLKTEILQSVLADFLMVGHENNGGSYALHTDKTGLWRTSINSLAQGIADVFNRHAIPQLFAVNGIRPSELPTIEPANVDPPDLTQLAQFFSATSAAGVQWFPDPTLEKFLRDAAQLPALDPKMENMLETAQRQQAVVNLAQQRLQMIQVEQQAVQGQLGMQQQAAGVAQQQQAQLEAGPEQGDQQGADAGNDAVDPNEAKRGELAVQTDKVKLDQEKAKLTNLRAAKPGAAKPAAKPAGRGKSAGRSAVRKSAFGVDHAPAPVGK